jgi:hypothetical protein
MYYNLIIIIIYAKVLANSFPFLLQTKALLHTDHLQMVIGSCLLY